MHSPNYRTRFNPLNYLYYKPEDNPFHFRSTQAANKAVSEAFRAPEKVEKVETGKNRYRVLPYPCEEQTSKLYCLLRRCQSVIEYLRDQLVHLSNTLKRHCLREDELSGAKVQMVNKQLSFLKILIAKINCDLNDYSSDLKEAVEKRDRIAGYSLTKEGVRIEAELLDFQNTITFTKNLLYYLLRKSPMSLKRPCP